jgi:peptidyl-prolyl cis-trans isomerase SurA
MRDKNKKPIAHIASACAFLLVISPIYANNMPASQVNPANIKNTMTTQTIQSNQKLTLINKAIAIVNNGVITSKDLSSAVDKYQRESQQSQLDSIAIQRQVLQQLISQKIAMQLAKKNNITVDHIQVSDAINEIIEKNGISQQQLREKLKQSGVSYKEYRENIKQSIIVSQLQQKAIANSIYISPKEIKSYLDRNQNNIKEYDLQHILLPLPKSYSPEDIALAEKKAKQLVSKINSKEINFYNAAVKYSQSGDALNGGALGWENIDQLPPIFASKVSTMKKGELYGPFLKDGNLHILYLKNIRLKPTKKHYEKQYNISQIVIKTSPVKTETQAKEQLSRITQSLDNGKSFAQLARENSQNYSNASSGGDMGWIATSSSPLALSKAMLQTPVGEFSKPFATQGGWQIIKVNKIRNQDITQQYLQKQAMNVIFQRKAQQAIKTWMNSIKQSAYIKILNPKLRPQEL